MEFDQKIIEVSDCIKCIKDTHICNETTTYKELKKQIKDHCNICTEQKLCLSILNSIDKLA